MVYRDGVQTELSGGGFESVNAMDISDDGELLLVYAGSEGDGYGSYLWSEQGGFVSVIDLFAAEGYLIPESALFNSMSGDGTVFAGNMFTEGYGLTSLVATIPSPGALLMLGGGLLMLSGRRR